MDIRPEHRRKEKIMAYEHKKTLMVTAKQLHNLCYQLLKAIGFSDEDAMSGANSLNASDVSGVETHGAGRIHMYSDMVEGGRINLKAQTKVTMEMDSLLAIDADHGLGIAKAEQAMKLSIEKAKKTGICATAIYNSGHCGYTGYYTYMAAKEGLFALGVSSTAGTMAPFGGRDAVLGNTPWGMAFPGTEKYPFPIMFDYACSMVAGGKIEMCLRNEITEIPVGWLVNKATGEDETDPRSYYQGKSNLLPMAGHKGYVLAVLLEILATIVTGSSDTPDQIHTTFSTEPGPTENVGHFYIVIDPARFRPVEQLQASLNAYLDNIKNSQPRAGGSTIVVPGELEYKARLQRETGEFPINYKIAEECLVSAVKYGYVPAGTTVEELFDKVKE